MVLRHPINSYKVWRCKWDVKYFAKTIGFTLHPMQKKRIDSIEGFELKMNPDGTLLLTGRDAIFHDIPSEKELRETRVEIMKDGTIVRGKNG